MFLVYSQFRTVIYVLKLKLMFNVVVIQILKHILILTTCFQVIVSLYLKCFLFEFNLLHKLICS